MRNFLFTSLLFGLTAVAGAASANAADRISVPVSGLRNDNGVVRCGLYAGAGAFPKAGQESRGVIAKIHAPAFASAAFDYAGGAETVPIRLTY